MLPLFHGSGRQFIPRSGALSDWRDMTVTAGPHWASAVKPLLLKNFWSTLKLSTKQAAQINIHPLDSLSELKLLHVCNAASLKKYGSSLSQLRLSFTDE